MDLERESPRISSAARSLLWIAPLFTAAVVAIGLLWGPASLSADPGGAEQALPTSKDLIAGVEDSRDRLSSARADEQEPGEGLGSGSGLELLEANFGEVVTAPAGAFQDLEIEKSLAPDVAVVSSFEPSAAEREEPGLIRGRALLHATVPLEARSASGELEPVDLTLQREGGSLSPVNPLSEVEIPQQLGDEIRLLDASVGIAVRGAPEEAQPSRLDGSVAVYEGIAPATDFAVTPTPTGIETFAQLRSAEAPRVQTLDLDLPPGAALRPTGDGGARVSLGEETLVRIDPPTAVDAAGEPVPVRLVLGAQSIQVSASPDRDAAYPILVDPVFHTYDWKGSNTTAGICSNSFNPEPMNHCSKREEWGYEHIDHASPPHISLDTNFYGWSPHVPQGTPGMNIKATGSLTAGDRGTMLYAVPRYFKDAATPTSYVSKLTLTNVLWKALSPQASPYFYAGIWDPTQSKWLTQVHEDSYVEHGLTNLSHPYVLKNESPTTGEPNTNGKVAQVSVVATANTAESNAAIYVGTATVELGDRDAPGQPTVSTNGVGWVDKVAPPLTLSASDTGLGVFAVSASTETKDASGQPWRTWRQAHGCKGVAGSACPLAWNSSSPGGPSLTYDPNELPTGHQYLNVVAEDPIGNKSAAASYRAKIDHTAPELTLSGSLTQQTSLGTRRPTYALLASATDGTVGSPQSGVAEMTVRLDGTQVAHWAVGCEVSNCALSREWTLDADSVARGNHKVKVTVVDEVGRATSKEVAISVHPAPAPTLSVSGSVADQQLVGPSRPKYDAIISAKTEALLENEMVDGPTAAMTLGAPGTGNGQLSYPAGIALDPQGTVWVSDGNRIQAFTRSGAYVTKFGSEGSGNGQLKEASALVVRNGQIWVADTGNHRIQVFNSQGEYVKQIGTKGTAPGQFTRPEGLAFDNQGNLWVADTGNARLQQFTGTGVFMKTVGSKGAGHGQFGEPTGIAVTSTGMLWVVDTLNNRIASYLNGFAGPQFGVKGSGPGQFLAPSSVAVDKEGRLVIADSGNGRIQVLSGSGTFIEQMGSPGTGAAQLNLTRSTSLAVEPDGGIWVTDSGNHRVQKWAELHPRFVRSVGGPGSSPGQFAKPAGVAVAPNGSVLVADDGRVQKFSEHGALEGAIGSFGSGAGQLKSAAGVAVDASSNIYVADKGNNRIQKFNSAGQFVSTFNGSVALAAPEDVEVDAAGDIWVADTGNGRLLEFTSGGSLLKIVGSKGAGTGQFTEPSGISFGPNGFMYVVDPPLNRVSMLFNGSFLGTFGGEGTGKAKFKTPTSVSVDQAGRVWVLDTGNARVQQLTAGGGFVDQFGEAGTGAGQMSLTRESGLMADTDGGLWIGDTNNDRLQKWSTRTASTSIKLETKVDGVPVDSASSACTAETCQLSRTWSLIADKYSPGTHTVEISATDALGRKSVVTESVEITRDSVPPKIETAGELASAPEGWVEQDEYGLTLKAEDQGYGVTSLKFKIDGEVVGQSSQSCGGGGCSLNLQDTIDMQPYAGGAHAAEVVAVDAAGNEQTKRWTINVDPEGNITTAEAEATLEAVEGTSDGNPIGPAVKDPEYYGTGEGLELTPVEGGLEATGTHVPTVIDDESSEGMEMEILPDEALADLCGVEYASPEAEEEALPEQQLDSEESPPWQNSESCAAEEEEATGVVPQGLEDIEVEPVTTAPAATEMAPVDDAAAISANTANHVDTIVRPLYQGALTFQAIRNAEAPTEYSWTVGLDPDQELKLLDSKHVGVYYDDGHPAFGIEAVPAHDATGADVSTTLSISGGNVVTLHVGHRASPYVYPVLSGVGWQGGYWQTEVEAPMNEQEEREERERIEQEEQEALEALEEGEGSEPGEATISWAWALDRYVQIRVNAKGPPMPVALASGPDEGVHRYTIAHKFKYRECFYPPLASAPSPPGGGGSYPGGRRREYLDSATEVCKGKVGWAKLQAKLVVHGWFRSNQKINRAWIKQGDLHCKKWGVSPPALVNCRKRPISPVAPDNAIKVLGDYRFPPGGGFSFQQPPPGFEGTAACVTVRGSVGVWGTDNIHDEETIITPAKESEKCDWPNVG